MSAKYSLIVFVVVGVLLMVTSAWSADESQIVYKFCNRAVQTSHP